MKAFLLNRLTITRAALVGSCISFLLAITGCGGGDSASINSLASTQSSSSFTLAQSKTPKSVAPKGR
jgi:hypothetical protein